MSSKYIFSFFQCIISVCIGIDVNGQSFQNLYEKGEKALLFAKYDSAAIHFEAAKQIAESKGDWLAHVNCLNKLSETSASKYDPQKAKSYALEAIQMATENLASNHIQLTLAINNLGNAYYLTGKHEAALVEYKKVMKVYDGLPDDQKKTLSAPVIMGIGNIYYSKYQYRDALVHFKEALELNELFFGKNHPNVAYSYMSLGNLYRNMGSFGNAEENYNKALAILTQFFGENHPSVASCYVGRAAIFAGNRQNELALQFYLKAQAIYEQFYDPFNPNFGDVLLGLGDICKNERRYENAISYYKNALDIFLVSVGREHQNSVRANLEIGNAYMYEEKIRQALDYYNQVLEINYMLVGENHVNTSGAYNNLGGVYYFIGNYDLSMKYYQRALKIDQSIFGNDHPSVANCYYNISRVYTEKGDTKMALDYIQKAINSSIINFEESDIYTNPSLLNYFDDKDLMWYLNSKGETLEAGFKANANVKGLDVALNSYVLSDSLIDKIRESYTDKEDQADLAKITNRIYASAVNAAYLLAKLITPENVKHISYNAIYDKKLKEYKDRLFYFSEKSKACMLFSSVAKSNAKNFGGVPDSLLQKEIKLKNDISQCTQELYIHADPEIKKELVKKLFESNRDYDALLIKLEKEHPKYHDLKYDIGVVTTEQIQKFLPDSAMLISYLISKDDLFIIQITKNDIKINKEAYNGPDFEKKVRGMRNSITSIAEETFIKCAYSIYKDLIPFKIPQNIKKIIVIPDGPIHYIPFEALIEQPKNENTAYDKLPYLINKYEFSYSYAANLVYRIFNNTKIQKEKASDELYALAPVKFEYTRVITDESKSQNPKTSLNKDVELSRQINTQIIIEKYPELLGTETEVNHLKEIYSISGKSFVVSLYDQASETRLKNDKIGNYKYLHFATHGFVSDVAPEKSGILLFQNDKKEDGILYAGEIYNVSLNAELVVLSACETGLGKTAFGEGLVGMGRSLIYAGAKNLIVSLWTVSDEATNQLMLFFYKNIVSQNVPFEKGKSLDYSTSLRKAKLELMKNKDYAAPYYWAPFILLGK
jgi:CHAT domain-containing protein/Tfp pilus assembly protein PilF